VARSRILIVEDEWLLGDTMAMMLRQDGYEVIGPVATVDAALAVIDKELPDMALLDVSLGEGPSYPIAQRLAANNVRFAFLTGFSRRTLPPEFEGSRIVTKPISAAELKTVVTELLLTPAP
jgi:DNA-binding response OmpR family regulator